MIIQNNTNSSKNSNRNSNDNKRNNHMKSTNVNTMEKKQMLIMVNIFEYMLINIHHKWPILIYQLLMDILATINQY